MGSGNSYLDDGGDHLLDPGIFKMYFYRILASLFIFVFSSSFYPLIFVLFGAPVTFLSLKLLTSFILHKRH